MARTDVKTRLIWHGFVLFFLGLITGFVIPSLTNPRMGLSAHMEGILNGMFLILVGGVVWDLLRLPDRVATAACWLFLYAAYGSWAFCLLAAVFGASQMLPIAGAGYSAEPWQEQIVAAGLGLVAISITLACCLVLYGFQKREKDGEP
jgi:hydroxylaminobenzene mutase